MTNSRFDSPALDARYQVVVDELWDAHDHDGCSPAEYRFYVWDTVDDTPVDERDTYTDALKTARSWNDNEDERLGVQAQERLFESYHGGTAPRDLYRARPATREELIKEFDDYIPF